MMTPLGVFILTALISDKRYGGTRKHMLDMLTGKAFIWG
jgi:hypothetical protein